MTNKDIKVSIGENVRIGFDDATKRCAAKASKQLLERQAEVRLEEKLYAVALFHQVTEDNLSPIGGNTTKQCMAHYIIQAQSEEEALGIAVRKKDSPYPLLYWSVLLAEVEVEEQLDESN